ncbi:hypothetical protein RIF29_25147 [Crotalaria pallida]|uniref:Uncharacterized protein n=1 Tax=Crotalaria pallida TaxID=3830 RepID=A0AAN9HX76_CROPI
MPLRRSLVLVPGPGLDSIASLELEDEARLEQAGGRQSKTAGAGGRRRSGVGGWRLRLELLVCLGIKS